MASWRPPGDTRGASAGCAEVIAHARGHVARCCAGHRRSVARAHVATTTAGYLMTVSFGALRCGRPGAASRRRGARRRRRRGARAARGRVVVAEDHALPGFARIDAEHRVDRNLELPRHPPKRVSKVDRLVAELERAGRRVRHVQHDLAVLHVLLRNLDAVAACVDDEMRREAVVDHPLVHRPEQIRALLGLRRGRQLLAYLLLELGEARLERGSREHLVHVALDRPRWSRGSLMLNNGNRQRIGAIVQSTSENSSLKKNFFAEKISTLDRMLSSSAFTARPGGLRSTPVPISSASEYQSFSIRYSASRNCARVTGSTGISGGCGKRSSRYSMITRESYSTRSRSTSVGTLLYGFRSSRSSGSLPSSHVDDIDADALLGEHEPRPMAPRVGRLRKQRHHRATVGNDGHKTLSPWRRARPVELED